jgi:hypothetical protein
MTERLRGPLLLTISLLKIIARCYRNEPIPIAPTERKIKDPSGSWVNESGISSKKLRDIIFSKKLCNPKIVLLSDDQKRHYFNELSKVVNVANKSRMLRLLYGDVYCRERLVRFNMSDNDTCRRCFQKETIIHLLSECPYTTAVYSLVGIDATDIQEILGVNLGKSALEIRCDILSYLVFRQNVMPPDILVKITLEKIAKGLAQRMGAQKQAKRYLREIFGETTVD